MALLFVGFTSSWEGAGECLGGSSCRGNIGFAAEVVVLVLLHKPQRAGFALFANHITASCAALSPAFVDRQGIHPPPPTTHKIRNQRDRVI